MKRIALLIAAVSAIAFLSTSCVKTRVCKCVSAINPSENYNYTYELVGKTKAVADCENQQSTGRTTYTPDYTCTLE